MAKPLGPKSSLIRDAINAHPDKAPKELAEMINASPARKEDRIKVKRAEISQQKQLMKKAGKGPAAKAPARAKAGRRPAAPAAARTKAPAATASPVELLDKVFDLARESGSITALKRLVDRLAEMQG
jgi:hypothetical protein